MASMVLEAGTFSPVTLVQTVTGGNTCRCGQDLDCSARAHCPRCGVTLHT